MVMSSYTVKAMVVAIGYWLLDSALHKFVFSGGEFVIFPVDPDELWMRFMIVLLLVSFGVYADKKTREVMEKEKEKYSIFSATVSSAQHILNNLLNNMQLYQVEADKVDGFDEEVKKLFNDSIREGEMLVKKLSAVEDLTEESIKTAVYPEGKK